MKFFGNLGMGLGILVWCGGVPLFFLHDQILGAICFIGGWIMIMVTLCAVGIYDLCELQRGKP